VYLASEAHLWSQAWVTVGFILLLVIAGLGATVLRANEKRLVETSEAEDQVGYEATLSTLRIWTLVTITLIVITIFLMSARPFA
jgi:hypothetical protein